MIDSQILDNIYKRRIKDGSGWWVMDNVAKEYYWKVGAEIIIDYIGKRYQNVTLIDWGGGIGNVANELTKRYKSIRIIIHDISKYAMEYGKKLYGDNKNIKFN